VSESAVPGVLGPLELLAYAAALSRRARLGVAVMLTAFRPPLQLARDVASLDRLSEGRAIVGVGLGNDRERYGQYGLTVANRAAHFESGLRVLRSLLVQERTTSQEPWWDLDEVARPVPPVQAPSPPIWVGARAPAALARAARLGDGWVGAGSSTLDEFETALGMLRSCLEEAGREGGSFSVSKRVYVHVFRPGEDRSGVRARLREWFDHHYGNPVGADRFVVAGTAAECADHLGRLRALGAATVILHPMIEPLAQLDLLAEEVAPQLN
jgi:alkanesulfonate monooxygenase SsuD/methylene tetrahydromethanopterin reductase-like flavin-dependent oxidoreductase (luciferase family)